MIDLFKTTPSIVDIASIFVNSLHVKISRSTLQKEIEEHPFYPSLLSISEVLSSFGIKNVTAKFDLNKIPDIPVPFLIQMKGEDRGGNFFSVVRKSDENSVEYYEPDSRKWKIEDRPIFREKCTGVVLRAQTRGNSGEKNYVKEIKKENQALYFQYFAAFILPAILLFQGVIGFIQIGSPIIIPFLLSILLLAGSLISFLLVWHDIDHFNPATQAICSAGKKVNCNAILDSSGGKIFGIKWSIIGFSYFLGSLIFILTGGLNNLQPLTMVWGLNLVATLYVFYSVYYQWKVAKTWCPLCLTVQLILVLITLAGFVAGWYTTIDFNIPSLIQLLTSFVIPFIGASMLYSAFIKAKENRKGKLEFQRSKRNPDVLNQNLAQQKTITEDLDGLGIVLGNPLSANKIVKVCNPYCGPCASVHDSIKELLSNSDDLSIQIIFTASNENNDIRALPVRHLLALYEKGDVNIEQALEDWYHADIKDYPVFASKYPLSDDMLSRQNQKIDSMRDWSNKTDISFTPTFFVNGHQLPPDYTISDLKYYFMD
ncbi:vitamin K epoxide reductase family protein [Pedobacter metabolipauper]|uniref:Protein-disulfide isomerase n=1 Tax=Pedobacter metabolipauper TaxID=425513 RepID=A0A4R6ST13_9SPHI|nr:vitamin K epoxide reductase family protein [Pedobacter metabolipauper]TDQ08447.1 protein-disulfide isomerase [Pedobacter metabolipauper]